jgi:electron transfer flavoprotein beta subunit
MNILVILRAVLDPGGFTVNRRAQKVFVNREQFIVNPSDKNALEAALSLATADDTVVAVAFGEAPAEDALRQARSLGAGRALLVRDPALKEADALVMTSALQRLAAQVGVELALMGDDVPDADLAQVGPRLAEALDWPFVAAAHQLARTDSGTLTAIVARPNGFHKVEVALPAVVSIALHSNKPRYAPGANIVNIYKDPNAVEALAAADLQLAGPDLTPRTERRGESFPPERELGRRLEGDVDEMARQVAEVIRKA